MPGSSALPTRPDFVELDISCPNVSDEFGRSFAGDAPRVTAAVKEVISLPIIVKLSPIVSA